MITNAETDPMIVVVSNVLRRLYGIEPGPQAGLAEKLDRRGSPEESMLADVSTRTSLQVGDELRFLLAMVFEAGKREGAEEERNRAQMQEFYQRSAVENMHWANIRGGE